MLVNVAGEPLVHLAARRAVEAGLAPLVVVVGHQPERVRGTLADLPCAFVHNPEYRSATSGSLHRALRSLPPDTVGAVILLADMPRVSAEMIGALRAEALSRSAPLVLSRYEGVVAPPLYFHRTLFPELLAWFGDGAGKAVAERHLAEATILRWPREALMDVDTPADLRTLS